MGIYIFSIIDFKLMRLAIHYNFLIAN